MWCTNRIRFHSFIAVAALVVALPGLVFSQGLIQINGQDWMIVEGDILVPATRAGLEVPEANYWPGGRVPYTFEGLPLTPPSTDLTTLVNDAIDHWEAAVQGLDFVFCGASCAGVEAAYIIFSESYDGCFSQGIGMKGPSGQIVNLEIPGCAVAGIAQHEIGHALGLKHTQNRPDRDAFVSIWTANIDPDECTGGCVTNNFTELHDGWGPYDYSSVMHYRECAFTGAGCPCANPSSCQSVEALDPSVGVCNRNAIPRVCVAGPGASCSSPPCTCNNDADCGIDMGQRVATSELDELLTSFLYALDDWRFMGSDLFKSGEAAGSFLNSYSDFATAYAATPAGGTLWILENETYPATGTWTKPMTLRAPQGARLE